MEIIKEIRDDMQNNSSRIRKGVYKTKTGFQWVTYTKSGECKKLQTAMKKAGF